MKPILFFFRGGRTVRLAAEGKFPEDLLYGFTEVSETYPVEILEQDELTPAPRRSWIREKYLQWKMAREGIKWDHVEWYATDENLKRFNNASALFTTTGTQGVALSILRHQKKLATPLIFLATGLCDYSKCPKFWEILREVAPSVIWTSLSQGEIRELEKRLGQTVHYVPFGTDVSFWENPQPNEERQVPYVLTVGNDSNRDYELLIQSWKPEYPELKIVTQRALPSPLPSNVQKVDSDWCFKPVKGNGVDELLDQAKELRELYRQAHFIVVPLQEAFQPSGQSVTQQGMISGKAVLVSKIKGMWNDELMKSGDNCLFVEPGSITDFQKGVEDLLKNKDLRNRLGKNGQESVIQFFSTRNTADALIRVLKSLITI